MKTDIAIATKTDVEKDIVENDLLFVTVDKRKDLTFVTHINYVAQKLKVRLQWFLGEWFLNTELGLPYFQDILVKNPNRVAVIDYFRKIILQTEGVVAVDNLTMIFENSPDRRAHVKFVAESDYGRISFDENLFIRI